MDFTSDTLWDGRKFRLLNVVDVFNREVILIEVDTYLPTIRLIRGFKYLKEFRELPLTIRLDNGPEFISCKLDLWCKTNQIDLLFIISGKTDTKQLRGTAQWKYPPQAPERL